MTWFHYLFQASMVLSLASMAVLLPLIEGMIGANAALFNAAGLSFASLFSEMVGMFLFLVLLWFLVIRFRSKLAKWALTLVSLSTGLSLILSKMVVVGPAIDLGPTVNILQLFNAILRVASGICLHLPSSRDWFRQSAS
jgi:hypothetical protein